MTPHQPLAVLVAQQGLIVQQLQVQIEQMTAAACCQLHLLLLLQYQDCDGDRCQPGGACLWPVVTITLHKP